MKSNTVRILLVLVGMGIVVLAAGSLFHDFLGVSNNSRDSDIHLTFRITPDVLTGLPDSSHSPFELAVPRSNRSNLHPNVCFEFFNEDANPAMRGDATIDTNFSCLDCTNSDKFYPGRYVLYFDSHLSGSNTSDDLGLIPFASSRGICKIFIAPADQGVAQFRVAYHYRHKNARYLSSDFWAEYDISCMPLDVVEVEGNIRYSCTYISGREGRSGSKVVTWQPA